MNPSSNKITKRATIKFNKSQSRATICNDDPLKIMVLKTMSQGLQTECSKYFDEYVISFPDFIFIFSLPFFWENEGQSTVKGEAAMFVSKGGE